MELYLYEQYMRLGPVFEVRAFGRKLIILAGPEANLFPAPGGQQVPSQPGGMARTQC